MARTRITVWTTARIALLAVCLTLFAWPPFGKPGDAREAERAAINAVLKAQQAAWNRGDVEAFLTGYWHSTELTFSGSNGVARGWDLKRETAGDVGGVFTLVWEKFPDGWKIIHDHTSTVSFPQPNP